MPRGRRGLHVVSNSNNNNNNNTSAGIPSKEPHGLMRSDGKRPDRLTLVPWNWEGRQTSGLGRHGRMYCGWFICGSNGKGGRRSKYRAELKISKYSDLEDKCVFQPIAVESLGPLNETACQFLKDLGRRISAQSGDERERESAFLFQVLSVVIQRLNAILLHNSFEAADHLG